MREEIARLFNVVLAVLVIAALWALATMRTSDARTDPASRNPTPIQNEKHHA